MADRRFVVGLIAALAAWNLMINLGVPRAWYVPANVVAAAVIVAWARRHRMDAAELGLERRHLRRGLSAGAVAGVVAAGAVVALATWSWSGRFFADDQFASFAVTGMLAETLLRIPLGTALFEEVAFRGVLFSALRRTVGVAGAVTWSSVWFGLWHIVPTLARLEQNPAGEYAAGAFAVVGLVGLAVVATGVAGAAFAWLRLRFEGVAAPLVLHATVNAVAAWMAWVAVRG